MEAETGEKKSWYTHWPWRGIHLSEIEENLHMTGIQHENHWTYTPAQQWEGRMKPPYHIQLSLMIMAMLQIPPNLWDNVCRQQHTSKDCTPHSPWRTKSHMKCTMDENWPISLVRDRMQGLCLAHQKPPKNLCHSIECVLWDTPWTPMPTGVGITQQPSLCLQEHTFYRGKGCRTMLSTPLPSMPCTIVNEEHVDEDVEKPPDSPIHPCCMHTDPPTQIIHGKSHWQPENPIPSQQPAPFLEIWMHSEDENWHGAGANREGDMWSPWEWWEEGSHRTLMHAKAANFLGNPPDDLPDDPTIDILLAAADDDPKTYQQAMQCSNAVAWTVLQWWDGFAYQANIWMLVPCTTILLGEKLSAVIPTSSGNAWQGEVIRNKVWVVEKG